MESFDHRRDGFGDLLHPHIWSLISSRTCTENETELLDASHFRAIQDPVCRRMVWIEWKTQLFAQKQDKRSQKEKKKKRKRNVNADKVCAEREEKTIWRSAITTQLMNKIDKLFKLNWTPLPFTLVSRSRTSNQFTPKPGCEIDQMRVLRKKQKRNYRDSQVNR